MSSPSYMFIYKVDPPICTLLSVVFSFNVFHKLRNISSPTDNKKIIVYLVFIQHHDFKPLHIRLFNFFVENEKCNIISAIKLNRRRLASSKNRRISLVIKYLICYKTKGGIRTEILKEEKDIRIENKEDACIISMRCKNYMEICITVKV